MDNLLNKKIVFLIVLSSIVLSLYLTLRIDSPNFDLKFKRHTSIIENSIEYPYKYRLINPFVANVWFYILKTVISEKAAFITSYFIQNLIIFLFLFYSVFKYFTKWFETTGIIISSLLFAFIIPLTLTGYDTLGDMTTAGLMASGFYFINNNKVNFLYPIVFIGAFNELQIILIVAFYFVAKEKNFKVPKVWLNCVLLVITFIIAYLIIYFIRGGTAGSNEFVWYFTKDAAFNISHKDWILLWVFLLTPFMIFALKNIGNKPEFLRRSLFSVIPFFYFTVFFFMARLREIDKALTIFLILIPLAVISLLPENVKRSEE